MTTLLNRWERDMKSLEQGLQRGLITRAELKRAKSRDGLPAWLMTMLGKAA